MGDNNYCVESPVGLVVSAPDYHNRGRGFDIHKG